MTSRELEVVSMVVAGMFNKQIAAEFRTAESTAKVQRSLDMEKMQEASFAELIEMIEKVRAPPERPRKPKLTNILLFGNPEIPTLNRFPSPIGITSFQLELRVLKNSNLGCRRRCVHPPDHYAAHQVLWVGEAKIVIDPFLSDNPFRDKGWSSNLTDNNSTKGGDR
jgi:DNA-binding CsgD family transcriptional regulator